MHCKELLWVAENYRNTIKFNWKEESKSIDVYLTVNTVDCYGTMTMRFGILFTLAILEYYTQTEQYERCAVIRDSIKRLNELYKADLPTSITDKWCIENMGLTALEILQRHYKK